MNNLNKDVITTIVLLLDCISKISLYKTSKKYSSSSIQSEMPSDEILSTVNLKSIPFKKNHSIKPIHRRVIT